MSWLSGCQFSNSWVLYTKLGPQGWMADTSSSSPSLGWSKVKSLKWGGKIYNFNCFTSWFCIRLTSWLSISVVLAYLWQMSFCGAALALGLGLLICGKCPSVVQLLLLVLCPGKHHCIVMYQAVLSVNLSTERLKWRPTFRQTRESMLRQTVSGQNPPGHNPPCQNMHRWTKSPPWIL